MSLKNLKELSLAFYELLRDGELIKIKFPKTLAHLLNRFGKISAAISVVIYIVLFSPHLPDSEINYSGLIWFSLIAGILRVFIPLPLSRFTAKELMELKILNPSKTSDPFERKLISRVYSLSRKAGLSTMPEVGIYQSDELTASITGPSKSHSLLMMSTGLLESLDDRTLKGMLAHEVAHIARQDMLSGAFVRSFLFSLKLGFILITSQLLMSSQGLNSNSISILEFLLNCFLIKALFAPLFDLFYFWFSRYQEYRADERGANLSSRKTMIYSLKALGKEVLSKEKRALLKTSQIYGHYRFIVLFKKHPVLSERIMALDKTLKTESEISFE